MRIKSISVKGFKACQQLQFEPGQVNVLIGSNGAGKSTLLEAIGILSAAMTDRVDNTALDRKGIRLSAGDLYQSNFQSTTRRSPTMDFEILWEQPNEPEDTFRYSVNLNAPNKENAWRYHSEALYKNEAKVHGRSGASTTEHNKYIGMLRSEDNEAIRQILPAIEKMQKYGIFQPNTPALRGTISDPYQSEPIGLYGGRLAEAVEDILVAGNNDKFGPLDIEDVLELIDWANQVRITTPNKSNINASVPTARRVIEFTDRYMRAEKKFTAYDASEGALYVLLLLSLAVHDKAPAIFAIDNFDHAMNPRLAKATTKLFCDLILATDKTVFLTTHNPLVLDGLDIQNDGVRLFTMGRTREGYAKINRVQVDQSLLDENLPLSRLWVNGRLGGVPELL